MAQTTLDNVVFCAMLWIFFDLHATVCSYSCDITELALQQALLLLWTGITRAIVYCYCGSSLSKSSCIRDAREGELLHNRTNFQMQILHIRVLSAAAVRSLSSACNILYCERKHAAGEVFWESIYLELRGLISLFTCSPCNLMNVPSPPPPLLAGGFLTTTLHTPSYVDCMQGQANDLEWVFVAVDQFIMLCDVHGPQSVVYYLFTLLLISAVHLV